jgi:hypothetical protein
VLGGALLKKFKQNLWLERSGGITDVGAAQGSWWNTPLVQSILQNIIVLWNILFTVSVWKNIQKEENKSSF